jgi:eukaryotic-like serine/threonine-protein kinase
MTSAGTSVGPYVILGPLGAGGMGEVHLARDPRLERDVALKMLPAPFAGDVQRLARFRREALTLASINHPNIATIFGFEEPSPGRHVLVMERVVGETLAAEVVDEREVTELIARVTTLRERIESWLRSRET